VHFAPEFMCVLNHYLEWDKWVLTNFDYDRQWFNTLIPSSHESAAVTVTISCLSRPLKLALRYTTPDIHCRDRRYEWDGGIRRIIMGNIMTEALVQGVVCVIMQNAYMWISQKLSAFSIGYIKIAYTRISIHWSTME